MVVKRNYLLTHIILIVFVIITIFPVVWVVSTSLRRDNAAFSTKLFSSRITFQNYIDLLAPEKNMPKLVSDIESIIMYAPPYNTKSVKETMKVYKDDSARFDKYLNETEQLYKNIVENVKKAEELVNSNSETLKNTLLQEIENTKVLINYPKPTSGIELAWYYFYKEEGMELTAVGVDRTLAESEWNRVFAVLYEKRDELKSQLDYLESDFNNYSRKFINQQNLFLSKVNLINRTVVPTLKNYISTFEAWNKLLEKVAQSQEFTPELNDTELFKKMEEMFYGIESFKGDTSKYDLVSDISNVINELTKQYGTFMSNWKKSLGKETMGYNDLLKSIDSFIASSSLNIEETKALIKDANTAFEKLTQYDREYNTLKSQITKVRQDFENTNAQIEKEKEKIQPALVYLRAEQSKADIQSVADFIKSGNFSKARLNLLSIQMRKLSGAVTSLNNVIGNYTKEAAKLRNQVKKFNWIQDLKDLYSSFDRFNESYNTFMSDVKQFKSEIDNKSESYIKLSYSGAKVRPKVLDELIETVLSDYRNNVVPVLSILSKKASDLADQIPLPEAKKSFKTVDASVFRIDQIWQRKPEHYMVRWLINSTVVALSVAIITTAVTALAAYPFSRMRFKGRKNGIMTLLLIQMFPAIMYMVAVYSLLSFLGKYIPGFGLNTTSGLIFAYLGGIAYNMFLIKGYYDTIPDSLEEAALIDGATRWQTFVKIVLPLATPILSVIVILTFMGTFNEFVVAKILLQDAKQYTYALGLWTFSSGPFETQWGLFTAAALIGIIPMVTLFLLMQKYIVGGLVKGAVKG